MPPEVPAKPDLETLSAQEGAQVNPANSTGTISIELSSGTYWFNTDGSVVASLNDGNNIFWNADGSVIKQKQSGDGESTTWFVDGTIEKSSDIGWTDWSSDGTIDTYINGVGSHWGGDGSGWTGGTDMTFDSNGNISYEELKSGDYTEWKTNGDVTKTSKGDITSWNEVSTTRTQTDGTIVTWNKDNSVTAVFTDGSQSFWNDTSVSTTFSASLDSSDPLSVTWDYSSGAETIEYADGTSVTIPAS